MRQWKVGTISLGVMLVLIGGIWIYSTSTGLPLLDTLFKWWPIVLILLGIEILIFSLIPKGEQVKVKLDGISIFLIILIVIFLAGAQFISTGISFFGSRFPVIFNETSSYNQSYEYSSNGKEGIKINGAIGQVYINKSDEEKITIDATIKYRRGSREFEENTHQNAITITDDKILTINQKLDGDLSRYNIDSIDYHITMPDGINIDVDNTFGETEIMGLNSNIKVVSSAGRVSISEVTGGVSIENSFGESECYNINGDINIKNSNGRIVAENISGKAELYGSLGAIQAVNVKGDTVIENSNGSIIYTSDEVTSSKVNLSNSLGKITLNLRKNQEGSFYLRTDLGGISDAFSLPVVEKDNGKIVEGNIGNGQAIFNVVNNNGSIEVNN